VQFMGLFFGFPPLKSSLPLHKVIRVEQVEDIPQLVRKAVDRFYISSPSDNHIRTDTFILPFLQSTFFNTMI